MTPELIAAVLHRGNHRCAWCAVKLGTEGTICKLDFFDGPASIVASCLACATEYSRWWDYSYVYTIENSRRILGRHETTGSGPFVDYLERATNHISISCGRMSGKVSGLYTPFTTALARIEAQRNAPLDVRRKVRAA